MYFPDLSPYTYFHFKREFADVVNVGWLDGPYPYKPEPLLPFAKGPTPTAAIERLFEFCLTRVNVTRGWYNSPFTDEYPYRATHGGRTIELGDAEVWVQSAAGRIYAAPNLIYHYIKDANYLPPAEYIAVLLDPNSRAVIDTHDRL